MKASGRRPFRRANTVAGSAAGVRTGHVRLVRSDGRAGGPAGRADRRWARRLRGEDGKRLVPRAHQLPSNQLLSARAIRWRRKPGPRPTSAFIIIPTLARSLCCFRMGPAGSQVYHEGQWHDVDPLRTRSPSTSGTWSRYRRTISIAPRRTGCWRWTAPTASRSPFPQSRILRRHPSAERTAALPSAQLGRVPSPPCRRRFRRLRHRGADQRVAHRDSVTSGVRFPDKADVSMAANHVMMRV